MKYSEVDNKGKLELESLASELKSKLNQILFDLADKKIKDTSVLKKTKRDLARVLTALNSHGKHD